MRAARTFPIFVFAAAAAASSAGGQSRPAAKASGTVVDVQRSEDGDVTVILLVGEEQELTLSVGPDTRVSVDGDPAPQEELDDALGAEATVRYREIESGLLLEEIDLSWPEEPDEAGALGAATADSSGSADRFSEALP